MKFFKLGLILSAVALSGSCTFAEEAQEQRDERPSALSEAVFGTYGRIYDPSKEYEDLQNEAMIDFDVLNKRKKLILMNIRNTSVGDNFLHYNGGFDDGGFRYEGFWVDEHKLSKAPIGAKRWVIYSAMAYATLNDSWQSYREACRLDHPINSNEKLQQELEIRKTEKTVCDALKCEQCCLDFANFTEPGYLSFSSPAPYLPSQEIRELAKQHAGKACKYHRKQISPDELEAEQQALQNLKKEIAARRSEATQTEKKEEAKPETQELVNPFVDGSAIPTPAFDTEEEVVRLFHQATGLKQLEASVQQDTRLAEFLPVIAAIKQAARNAFNYEVQYKKLTTAIRHRFGANLFEIIKFIKN